MKKIQLVEIGLIATVLVIGYKMITALFTMLTTLLLAFGTRIGQNVMVTVLPAILIFSFYTITFFVLARNVKPLAKLISRQTDDLIDIKLNKATILHMIIITVCLISFLQTIPDILEYLINKSLIHPVENDERIGYPQYNTEARTFINSAVSLLITLILLITSKKIALFFGQEDRSFEIAGEKIESNI